jgi:hypothetical protein
LRAFCPSGYCFAQIANKPRPKPVLPVETDASIKTAWTRKAEIVWARGTVTSWVLGKNIMSEGTKDDDGTDAFTVDLALNKNAVEKKEI